MIQVKVFGWVVMADDVKHELIWMNPLNMSVWCRVRTVMGNLEKSWNFKMVISRPGKVMERTEIIKVLEKSRKCSFTK